MKNGAPALGCAGHLTMMASVAMQRRRKMKITEESINHAAMVLIANVIAVMDLEEKAALASMGVIAGICGLAKALKEQLNT